MLKRKIKHIISDFFFINLFWIWWLSFQSARCNAFDLTHVIINRLYRYDLMWVLLLYPDEGEINEFLGDGLYCLNIAWVWPGRTCWVILHSWRQSHPFQADHVSMEKIFLFGICCPWHWKRNPDLDPELITQQGCFTHLFMGVDYRTKDHHFGRHHWWFLKFSHRFTKTPFLDFDITWSWF